MDKFEMVKAKLADGLRAHERALEEAAKRFDALSPEEQMREQLRKWEHLLAQPLDSR